MAKSPGRSGMNSHNGAKKFSVAERSKHWKYGRQTKDTFGKVTPKELSASQLVVETPAENKEETTSEE